MMITQQLLDETFDINVQTGEIRWKVSHYKIKAGDLAGSAKGKYREITFNGHRCLAHRLIWFYANNAWPSTQIDHINGNKLDNSISNLRLVNNQQNSQNKPKNKNNTSGKAGISWTKANKKWRAYIWHMYKRIHLGYFDDYDEAVKARERAELVYQPFRVVNC